MLTLLLQDIKQAEGCKLTAYKDSLELWTIGYGHLLSDQNKDWTGYTITQAQADSWLEADIQIAYDSCIHLPEWASLDTLCRQNAVIELTFNMGGKWRQFAKARLAIQNHNWKEAHDELLDSLWAKQVQPQGLDKPGRATRLADYLLTGKYPNGIN